MTKSGELVTHSSPSEPSIMQFKVVNPRFMGFVLLQVGGPNGPVPWHEAFLNTSTFRPLRSCNIE